MDLGDMLWGCGLDSSVWEQGQKVSSCKHGDELFSATKDSFFLTVYALARQ
jgi:hypothetical protein